jgi:hypothetical protein
LKPNWSAAASIHKRSCLKPFARASWNGIAIRAKLRRTL